MRFARNIIEVSYIIGGRMCERETMSQWCKSASQMSRFINDGSQPYSTANTGVTEWSYPWVRGEVVISLCRLNNSRPPT